MRYDDAGNEKPMYLVKPTIERISFSLADNDTMAEDLASGKFHLVNKVTYGPTINECRGLGAGSDFGEDELAYGGEEEDDEDGFIEFDD